MSLVKIDSHTAALRHATETHRAHAHQLRQLAAEDAQALAYIDQQLQPWIHAAKQQEAALLAALDAHAAANAAWRDAAGRLLAEARAAGDLNAAVRVAGLDAAYRGGAARHARS